LQGLAETLRRARTGGAAEDEDFRREGIRRPVALAVARGTTLAALARRARSQGACPEHGRRSAADAQVPKMNVPLEITFRGVEKTDALEALVREQAAKLERVCNYLSSCRVAIEKPHSHERAGTSYRVRIDATVPPGHEIAVTTNALDHDMHEQLSTVVIAAFKSARRRLEKLVDRQHGDVKAHDDSTAPEIAGDERNAAGEPPRAQREQE
jgi:ribosome-associated translation inhibitor RaiA